MHPFSHFFAMTLFTFLSYLCIIFSLTQDTKPEILYMFVISPIIRKKHFEIYLVTKFLAYCCGYQEQGYRAKERYTHKTSGFKTSGFKRSGFKTSGLQNVRFTKRQASKRLVSKRPVLTLPQLSQAGGGLTHFECKLLKLLLFSEP